MTGCTLCRAHILPHENKRKETAGVYLASDFFQCRLYSHMLPSSSFTVTPAASGLQRAFLGRLYLYAYMYVCIYISIPTYLHTYIYKQNTSTGPIPLIPSLHQIKREAWKEQKTLLFSSLFFFGLV